MYNFQTKQVTNDCINWIRNWFQNNGKDCNAIVGISGGKDSSIVAKLCVEALGKNRVIGVLMPNGVQQDINVAIELCNYLDIKYFIINVKNVFADLINSISKNMEVSEQTKINLPPRLRMATLYAVSQSNNGRVANTCNLSEDWVGYATRYGDSVGDFSPLSQLTVTEVKAIGRELNLPSKFVDKIPTDGLCGKTDEDNLGFTYEMLDNYIRNNVQPPIDIKNKIDTMHTKNLFKLQPIPYFKYISTLPIQ